MYGRFHANVRRCQKYGGAKCTEVSKSLEVSNVRKCQMYGGFQMYGGAKCTDVRNVRRCQMYGGFQTCTKVSKHVRRFPNL